MSLDLAEFPPHLSWSVTQLYASQESERTGYSRLLEVCWERIRDLHLFSPTHISAAYGKFWKRALPLSVTEEEGPGVQCASALQPTLRRVITQVV